MDTNSGQSSVVMKPSISIKFPNIYSATPSPTPSLTSTNLNSSFSDLNKFSQDINRVEQSLLLRQGRADSELSEIKNELIKVIVTTLMNNRYANFLIIFPIKFCVLKMQNSSDKDWSLLVKYFESLRPIKGHIENDRRVAHYLERIYSYTNRTCHRDSSALILNKLADLFPHVFYKKKYLRCLISNGHFSNNFSKVELNYQNEYKELKTAMAPSMNIIWVNNLSKINPQIQLRMLLNIIFMLHVMKLKLTLDFKSGLLVVERGFSTEILVNRI